MVDATDSSSSTLDGTIGFENGQYTRRVYARTANAAKVFILAMVDLSLARRWTWSAILLEIKHLKLTGSASQRRIGDIYMTVAFNTSMRRSNIGEGGGIGGVSASKKVVGNHSWPRYQVAQMRIVEGPE